MTRQPDDGVAASIDATYAICQPGESEAFPSDAQLIAERRTPAYTAVREYIRTWPPGTADPATVTRIWRALELGLDAIDAAAGPMAGTPDWTVATGPAEPHTVLDTPAGQSALDRILADAEHHEKCAALSAEKHPDVPELAGAHTGMAAGLWMAAAHVARGNAGLVARVKERIDQAGGGTFDSGKISLRKADVDLANAQASRDRWRRDYAELATRHKRVLADRDAERELSADLRARLKATSDAYSDADTALHELRKGEEPHPEHANFGTPGQWIWRWNRVTPEQRLDMARRILQAFETAEGCFLLNHKTEAPRRQATEAALGRVRAVAEELIAHGCSWSGSEPEAGRRILAALESPKEQS